MIKHVMKNFINTCRTLGDRYSNNKKVMVMRTICIYNHKGGVGKTTTALNLAAGLSRHEKKVLLVDLDPQGNLDTSLKVNTEYNLYDALTGKLEIQQCITNIAKNFDIIVSTEQLAKIEHFLSRDDNQKMMIKEILGRIDGYDFIIIDCPPSLGIINQNALAFCKEAIVPVSTDFLGYDALKKMPEIIDEINHHYGNEIKIAKVVPTLYDQRNKICKESLANIQNTFPEQTSYPIRNNSKLKEAPKKGKSIFNYAKSSNGSKDYGKLVEDIMAMT